MPRLLVNIDVDDLERGIAFYTRGLGLTVGRRLSDQVVELNGADCPVYLLEKAADSPAFPGAGEPRRYHRHWTPVHLDFVVEDFDAALAAALEAGAVLEQQRRDYAWGLIAYLSDPFGNGICLIQFLGRGYDELLNGTPTA